MTEITPEMLLTQNLTLIAEFTILGSNSRKSNSRSISFTGKIIKSKQAREYVELFGIQIDRVKKRLNLELPLKKKNLLWVFEFWYKNVLSDVSAELLLDLLEKYNFVENDNMIRNYICLGRGFDKYAPRTKITIYEV